MKAQVLVVVSGLPASGKSTLASALSEGLPLTLLDKDSILESLFDSLGCNADSLIEVFCDCPLDVAAARFAQRERHPGHLDASRSTEEREQGLEQLRAS